jgi:hypothetical protein
MVKRRQRIAVVAVLCIYVIALWTWTLFGFSTQASICDPPSGAQNCTSHNILVTLILYAVYELSSYGVLITALATIAIAYFTLTLKRSTDKLWEAADQQFKLAKETSDRQAFEIQNQIDIAREANRAAQKSADAAVAADRARLYVNITHNFMDCINAASAYENTPTVDENPLAASHLPMAKIRFKNYGKTPAILVEVATGIVYSETVPDPVWDVKVVNENIIGVDQTTEEFSEVISGTQMTLGMAKKVRDGIATIWIFGYASYDDVFGERQTHRFFQRLVRVGHYRYALQAYDHKHYNHST